MEIITENPGLQHISETIFVFLGKNDLLNCRLVGKSWKKNLDQTNFWFNKLETENAPNGSELANKNWKTLWNNHKTWKILAQKLDDDQTSEEFAQVLIWMYKRKLMESIHPLEIVVDLAKAKKCSEFVLFIIENVDTKITVDLKTNVRIIAVNVKGVTPCHLAAFFGLTKSIEKMMIRNPSLVVQTTKSGSTPIFFAAFNGQLEIVKYLAGLMKNPNSSNNWGFTPIHTAAYSGHLEIVKFLADFTDTPNSKTNDGGTPIHNAAFKGNLNIVKFLADFTDAPNSKNDSGITPIHNAAIGGHLEIVKFLASFTENPNDADNQGKTPIYFATICKHFEIVKFLESVSSSN